MNPEYEDIKQMEKIMGHKKLHIGIPYLEKRDNKMRCCALIKEEGEEDRILWYEVGNEFKESLVSERSDAFVVNLLYYAMIRGCDIISEAEMSEKLHYQLDEYWIPTVVKSIDSYTRVRIIAPLSAKSIRSSCEAGVGTGLSGGVDSFFTLLNHVSRAEKSWNVTHVTYLNLGGIGYRGIRENEDNRISHLQSVADEFGLKLVCVDTNEAEFYKGIQHVETHSLRTLSQILILQKLFRAYYFSSAYSTEDFHITSAGSAYYDLMTIPLLSTEDTLFYSHDAKSSRNEKLEYISLHPITYSKLRVCFSSVHNCGKCEKCKRTMLELDLLGKINLYKDSFDINAFQKRKKYFLMEAIYWKKKKQFWKEIYDGYKTSGRMPFSVQLCGRLISALPGKKPLRILRKLESDEMNISFRTALKAIMKK